jgi:regulator of replication initiation timing
MSPHIARVVEEQAVLQLKIDKLNDFLDSSAFTTLTENQRWLLMEQADAMMRYNAILRLRIELG